MSPRASRCDVLVIGGGPAALCAAVAARRAGAGVRLVEKAPRDLRGGNARHARNLRITHTAPTPLSPGCYPEDEYLAEIQAAAAGLADATLARLLVRQSCALPAWLQSNGVWFQAVSGGGLPPSRRTMFLLGGGKAAVNALYATARRLGVEIRYGSAVTALALQGARVGAVRVADAEGEETVRAGAVVVCSGGYQANPDRLRPTWGEAADAFLVRGTPYATGEVLHDLLDQGVAAAGVPGACHFVAVDARSPRFDGGIVTRALAIPAGIVVDRDGRRFHDEAAETGPARYALWGRLLARCPGASAHLVLDEAALRGAPLSIFPPIRAATIADLATAIGVGRAALQATLDGLDALMRPPFAAIPLRPGITFTCHGVRVDAQARVLMQNGQASENLFAAGMIMAPNVLGTGYLAGAAMTLAAVFGRIAGEQAAHQARG
jgi:tricarballylate dehydrogenase